MNITEFSKDFLWTADGDLFLDPANIGSPAVADKTRDEVLTSNIMKRLNSTSGDWADNVEIGANLIDFVGLPNTIETASLIRSRIIGVLTQDNLIRGRDLRVETFPIEPNLLLIAVYAKSLTASGSVTVGFTFDIRDNKMVPRIINV